MAYAFLNLDTGHVEPEPEPRRPAYNQLAYNQMIANLDGIMNVMTTEFGKTEAEAQAWLQSFITLHYFPVWRAMNTKG